MRTRCAYIGKCDSVFSASLCVCVPNRGVCNRARARFCDACKRMKTAQSCKICLQKIGTEGNDSKTD